MVLAVRVRLMMIGRARLINDHVHDPTAAVRGGSPFKSVTSP
jgi:hypothetical protein